MLEQVRPVDRPLFATGMLTAPATPDPACGAPATGTPFPSAVAPRYRIFPAGSTFPDTTCAIAASIFDADAVLLSVSRLANCERLATVVVWFLLHRAVASINPGWTIASPSAA